MNAPSFAMTVFAACVALALGMFGTMIATYPNEIVLARLENMSPLELRLLGVLMLLGTVELVLNVVSPKNR